MNYKHLDLLKCLALEVGVAEDLFKMVSFPPAFNNNHNVKTIMKIAVASSALMEPSPVPRDSHASCP